MTDDKPGTNQGRKKVDIESIISAVLQKEGRNMSSQEILKKIEADTAVQRHLYLAEQNLRRKDLVSAFSSLHDAKYIGDAKYLMIGNGLVSIVENGLPSFDLSDETKLITALEAYRSIQNPDVKRERVLNAIERIKKLQFRPHLNSTCYYPCRILKYFYQELGMEAEAVKFADLIIDESFKPKCTSRDTNIRAALHIYQVLDKNKFSRKARKILDRLLDSKKFYAQEFRHMIDQVEHHKSGEGVKYTKKQLSRTISILLKNKEYDLALDCMEEVERTPSTRDLETVAEHYFDSAFEQIKDKPDKNRYSNLNEMNIAKRYYLKIADKLSKEKIAKIAARFEECQEFGFVFELYAKKGMQPNANELITNALGHQRFDEARKLLYSKYDDDEDNYELRLELLELFVKSYRMGHWEDARWVGTLFTPEICGSVLLDMAFWQLQNPGEHNIRLHPAIENLKYATKALTKEKVNRMAQNLYSLGEKSAGDRLSELGVYLGSIVLNHTELIDPDVKNSNKDLFWALREYFNYGDREEYHSESISEVQKHVGISDASNLEKVLSGFSLHRDSHEMKEAVQILLKLKEYDKASGLLKLCEDKETLLEWGNKFMQQKKYQLATEYFEAVMPGLASQFIKKKSDPSELQGVSLSDSFELLIRTAESGEKVFDTKITPVDYKDGHASHQVQRVQFKSRLQDLNVSLKVEKIPVGLTTTPAEIEAHIYEMLKLPDGVIPQVLHHGRIDEYSFLFTQAMNGVLLKDIVGGDKVIFEGEEYKINVRAVIEEAWRLGVDVQRQLPEILGQLIIKKADGTSESGLVYFSNLQRYRDESNMLKAHDFFGPEYAETYQRILQDMQPMEVVWCKDSNQENVLYTPRKRIVSLIDFNRIEQRPKEFEGVRLIGGVQEDSTYVKRNLIEDLGLDREKIILMDQYTNLRHAINRHERGNMEDARKFLERVEVRA